MIIVENCCQKNQVPQICLYLFGKLSFTGENCSFSFFQLPGATLTKKKKVRQTSPRKGWNCTSVENSGKSWYGAKVHSFRWTGFCWGWVGGYSFKKLYNGLVLERFAGVFCMRNWVSNLLTQKVSADMLFRTPKGATRDAGLCPRTAVCRWRGKWDHSQTDWSTAKMTVMSGETAWEWEHKRISPMRGVRKDLCGRYCMRRLSWPKTYQQDAGGGFKGVLFSNLEGNIDPIWLAFVFSK